ncbi:response regulator [Legionella fairfieldensis]|uniref:response regulator n=1 Tax=Legionella fairfieldensis TaxID=45064 RepID=UPI000A060E73|nr:response regulator [Legionella fairfieldensis]
MTKPFPTDFYKNKINELQNKLNQQSDLVFQHESLINSIPGDVYWKDKEGVWLGLNHHCAKSLQKMGFIKSEAKNEVLGKTDYQLFDKITAEGYRQHDIQVMKSKKKLSIEEKTTLFSGDTVILLSTKHPLFDKTGHVIGVIGNTIDITYLKKIESDLKFAMEKADAANLAKTEFLENMRHDIRTPLTGIVGFADILKMESDTPQIKDYADNLVASSHALLDLLDEVLEAVRVSSGEIPKLKKKFNLQKSLQQVIDLNLAKAAQKKLDLTLDFDEHIPPYVLGDKVRIHRIMLELVANALNFTDSGFVKLSAKLAQRNHRELILKLIVEDSGIGIPKDKQQEIYVQFKRLTPSYQGIYKGAGLGLSVVKQFIDELDGEIYVQSEPKKGSTFTCIIPLQEPLLNDPLGIDDELEEAMDSPYETTYAEEIKPLLQKTRKNSYRVLVVEDNAIAQKVAQSILAQLACESDLAENGEQALELWKSKPYDLIFMDIGLPDIDGYEVTHRIRVQELTRKTHSPVIALTAHAGDENKKRCIEAGMNAVLSKPLTMKHCIDIVNTFIRGRQSPKTTSSIMPYSSDLPEQEADLLTLDSFPLLDIEEGIKTMGEESILAEMLTLLVNDTLPNDLALMQKAHAANDWDQTQQVAHKIKGGAVYVGTMKLKMACQYLERYWKSGQRELLERLYQQASAVIHESIHEMEQWLKAH